MKPAPLITVVVPVYNQEHYLPRCFDCLLAQTLPDWQAVLVDDGSTDGSGAVCDAYAARDARFTVIHKPNGGVCSARNAGMRAAEGEYITLLDQDDLLSPLALELALKAQTAWPKAWVMFRHAESRQELAASPSGTPPAQYLPPDAGKLYTGAPFDPPWCKLYSAAFLRKTGLAFDETVRDGYEDRPFVQAYLREFWAQDPAAPVLLLPEALYYWEPENPGSVSKRWDKPLTWAQIKMFDDFLQDCTGLYGVPPKDLVPFCGEAANILAFGITCLDAAGRRTILKEYYASGAYRRLMAYFETVKHYNVFYLPLKYKQTWLLRRLTYSRLGAKKLYWKCYWLGWYLLGASWER